METIVAAVGLILYKVTILLVGALFAVLGYRLFKLGYYEKAGELRAAWGKSHLLLKQTAPGVFFALFGAFIVMVGTWKPLILKFPAGSPSVVSTEDVSEPSRKLRSVLEKVANGNNISAEEKAVITAWLNQTATTGPGFHGTAWNLDILKLLMRPDT